MKCPNCGGEILQGMPMCPRCGQQVSSQAQRGKYCVHCKAVIPANAVVCPKCGRSQVQQQAAKKPPKAKKPGGFRWWYVPVMIALVFVGYCIGLGSAPGVQTNEPRKSKASSSISEENSTSQDIKDSPPSETEDSHVNEKLKSDELYQITYQYCELTTDTRGRTSCNAIIEVENISSVDLYLGSPVYDFEDSTGKLIGMCDTFAFGSSDPEIIAPGEKGYFYSNGSSVSGSITPDMDYIFVPHLEIEESVNDIVRYDLSDLSITKGSFGPCTITGRVTNNTEKDAGSVWISFILYGTDEKPLGIYGTNLYDLDAGITLSFSADALPVQNVSFEDIVDYKVFACKHQYQ